MGHDYPPHRQPTLSSNTTSNEGKLCFRRDGCHSHQKVLIHCNHIGVRDKCETIAAATTLQEYVLAETTIYMEDHCPEPEMLLLLLVLQIGCLQPCMVWHDSLQYTGRVNIQRVAAMPPTTWLILLSFKRTCMHTCLLQCDVHQFLSIRVIYERFVARTECWLMCNTRIHDKAGQLNTGIQGSNHQGGRKMPTL